MATQFDMNTYQEQWAIPEKIQAKQMTVVGETWNSQGYWRKWKFQGSVEKEVEFPPEFLQKLKWND